jgi:hypothetical protein
MTINEIINEAINNSENINEDGSINWNFVDYDLWIHPESEKFTDEELTEGFLNFPILQLEGKI